MHKKHKKLLLIILPIVAILLLLGAVVPQLLMGRDWNDQGYPNGWQAPKFGSTPECPSPLFSHSPVDTNLMSVFLYPGQYRGTDYKAHGGFHLTQGAAEISLPMPAQLVAAAKYNESGDLQYLLEFRNDCGIVIRFDHLHVVSPAVEEYLRNVSIAEDGSTRTTPVQSPTFPAGTVIASEVGIPSMNNMGFDFGVYDLRQTNDISRNPQWSALPIHQENWSQHAYGICWFNLLPTADANRIAAREAILGKEPNPADRTTPEKAISDYCPNAQSRTLDHNNGQPPVGSQF